MRAVRRMIDRGHVFDVDTPDDIEMNSLSFGSMESYQRAVGMLEESAVYWEPAEDSGVSDENNILSEWVL